MGKTISFLIPSYNDALTIGTVVREAIEVGKRIARKFEVIVINDGSTDGTRYPPATVISHVVNQGYGQTIKELYYAGKYEWLFTIPGDYQVGAKELLKLIPYTPSADMILGWRQKRNDPRVRLFVSWVYNTLLRLLFGLKFHDINSVRLMRRSILKEINLTSSSAFVDAELVIRAKRLGFTVIEVPISHRPRADGKPGGGNQWQTIAATIFDMIRFLP